MAHRDPVCAGQGEFPESAVARVRGPGSRYHSHRLSVDPLWSDRGRALCPWPGCHDGSLFRGHDGSFYAALSGSFFGHSNGIPVLPSPVIQGPDDPHHSGCFAETTHAAGLSGTLFLSYPFFMAHLCLLWHIRLCFRDFSTALFFVIEPCGPFCGKELCQGGIGGVK